MVHRPGKFFAERRSEYFCRNKYFDTAWECQKFIIWLY